MLKSVSKLRLLVDETRDAYLRGDVSYIIELDGIAERIEQEVSERFMELPKDADGVPIHAGDVLTDGKHTYTVTSVTFDSFAVTVCGHSETSLNSWPIDQPGKMRHHHEPTVEDVLRDMHAKLDEVTALYVGEAIDSDERDSDEARIFAEYAQRLQLREVDE